MVTKWLELDKKYPEEYDLVEVMFDDGVKQMGWWSGQVWDGYKSFEDKTVEKWRKRHYETLTSDNC